MSGWKNPRLPWTHGAVSNSESMPFPILQRAVKESVSATQASTKMVFHSALNAVFPAVQALADFERPDGGALPLTNISLIVGESAERKSSVDRDFFHEFYELRTCNKDDDGRADVEYNIREKTWVIKQKLLDKQLKASIVVSGSPSDELREALIEHGLNKPRREPKAAFIYEDTTLTALKRGLVNYPFACVHSSEGMSILNGPLFEEKSLLCTLYSGDTYFFDRANENIVLRDRRLCVSAYSHPLRTIRFLEKHGDEFRASGLAARMTVCLVDSTQGYRSYDAVQVPATCRNQFNDRVRYLLKVTARSVKMKSFRRRRIKLDYNAAKKYLEDSNRIEEQMRPGGKYSSAREYAGRLAEKIGRLAAAIHLFEDLEGDISLSTYTAACLFYEEESKDSLYLFNYIQSEDYLADQLWAWLQKQSLKPGEFGIKKSYVMQCCPYSLRKKVALDPLLCLLEQQGKVKLQAVYNTIYVLPWLAGNIVPQSTHLPLWRQ